MSKKKNPTPEQEQPEVAVAQEENTPAADFSAESEKLASLEAQLTAEKERYLRLAAEYDNFRKRSAKEREALYNDVRADTIVKLLPVYDNLTRALSQETEDKAFYKGVEMTMTQFEDILAKLNVTKIAALGEAFDPELHNAVMHVEDEQYGQSVVIDEYEKGFKLGDRVIRFSVVRVAN